MNGSKHTLIHLPTPAIFVVNDPKGTEIQFHDLTQTKFPQGAFNQ